MPECCDPSPCDESRPCPLGQTCQNGTCVDTCADIVCPPEGPPCIDGACPPIECVDGECPEGYQKVENIGGCHCLPPGSDPCGESEPCPQGYECVDDFCTPSGCDDDADCPTDYECVTGVCVPACADVECDEGEICISGTCITTCTGDEDCNACDACYPAYNPDGTLTGGNICAPITDVTPGSVVASISSIACAGVVGNVVLLPSYDGGGNVTGWSYTGPPGSGIGTMTISIDCDGDVTLTYEAGGFGPSTMTCTIDRFCCRVPDGSCTANLTGDTCSGSAVTIDVG